MRGAGGAASAIALGDRAWRDAGRYPGVGGDRRIIGDRRRGGMAMVVQAVAAGAILTMLADTMMPEGFEHAGNSVGLVTSAGFVSAFLLSHLA